MEKIIPLVFYLLRIPSFPFNDLINVNQIIGMGLTNANKEKLKMVFSNDSFQKAIFLASKPLFDSCKRWLNSDILEKKAEKKLISSLYKYYVRMCSRPTPYGLFAGYSFGNISEKATEIELMDNYLYPQIDIDLRVLDQINDFILTNNSAYKFRQTYFTNNTIYKISNRYRYIDYYKMEGQKKHILSEINHSELLEYILSLARNGIAYNVLLENLMVNSEGADADKLLQYIDNLIQSNILINEEIDITNSKSPFEQLKDRYAGIKECEVSNILEIIKESYKTFSDEKIVQSEDIIRNLFSVNVDQFLKVNLKINTAKNNINKKIIDEIAGYVEDLFELESRATPKDLLEFKQKFIDKYDSQEMPLKQVIDFDLGIGYGLQVQGNIENLSLLENINYSLNNQENTTKVNTKKLKFLSRKLQEAQLKHLDKIEILEKDLLELRQNELKVNDHVESSFLMGTLLSTSPLEADKGNYMFLTKTTIPGPYMANLLSRFAYSDGDYIDKIRKQLDVIQSEDKEGLIYAEIIYNPSTKMSNIILRPNFYNYHIPYGGATGKNLKSFEISVDDLFISVQNNQIVLKSKTLCKEVLPRLTSAYNSSIDGLPLFRFLCDLQFQNVNTGFSWNWGIFNFYDFLPRVQYKKIILSPAQWNLKKDKNQILSKLIEISKKSRYCYIAKNDNELVLDMQNQYCLNLIEDELRKRDITLYEYISPLENSIIKKTENSFASEIIIPFQNINRKLLQNNLAPNTNRNDEIIRNYYPGQKWIYYKIYLSHTTADKFLIHFLKNFLKNQDLNSAITRWFFIRYEDPKNHLRIRIQNKDISIDKITEVFISTFAQFIDDGLINDISINTYQRELERYGGGSIDFAEDLFYYDSNSTLDILDLINKSDNEHLRDKIAFVNTDMLLDDFNLSVNEKFNLMQILSANFFNEFIDRNQKEKTSSLLRKSLSNKFREEKHSLEKFIFNKQIDDELKPYVEILRNRTKLNLPIVEKILNAGLSKDGLHDLIGSFLHMSLNRLFHTKQRAQEMVVYNLLKMMYNSILNRNDK